MWALGQQNSGHSVTGKILLIAGVSTRDVAPKIRFNLTRSEWAEWHVLTYVKNIQTINVGVLNYDALGPTPPWVFVVLTDGGWKRA